MQNTDDNGPSIGHNRSSSDLVFDHIDDLYDEAKNWADGSPIENDDQEKAVASLINMLREAKKAADDARKAEKKPHDDAGKAVQAKFKPYLDKADKAMEACKRYLTPWLAAKERARAEEARKARSEAERALEEAARAFQNSASDNLAAREEAEAKADAAKNSDIKARQAEKQKVTASAGQGRALGLRSEWTVRLTDLSAAVFYYRDSQELADAMVSLARRDVRAGRRSIPGFEITETTKVQ